MERLKLIALDRDDMEVVSAHLQDAVIKAADVHWRPSEKRVVVALNRFDWEAANGVAPASSRTDIPIVAVVGSTPIVMNFAVRFPSLPCRCQAQQGM